MLAARFHRAGNAGAISLRHTVVGGQLTPARTSPPDLLEREDDIILFVHGFNVTQAEADQAYGAFEEHLRPSLRKRVVRLYWPGDTATLGDVARGKQGLATKIVSPIAYMIKPSVAIRAAEELQLLLHDAFQARVGSRKNKPLSISIIAHSLGCRLTLETLHRVWISSGFQALFPLTVLMAAAVPQYSVTGRGLFAGLLKRLPLLWVLHSHFDTVLRRFFRPGQFMERAIFPDLRLFKRGALGRKGIAPTGNIQVAEGTWDHSDYWPDREIARAVDRELSGTSQPSAAFETFSRTIKARVVHEREAAERVIAGLPPLY